MTYPHRTWFAEKSVSQGLVTQTIDFLIIKHFDCRLLSFDTLMSFYNSAPHAAKFLNPFLALTDGEVVLFYPDDLNKTVEIVSVI